MKALTTLISDGNDLLTITKDQLDEWPTDVPESATITIEVNGITAEGVVDSTAMTLVVASPIVAPKGSCVTYSWMRLAACDQSSVVKVCTPTTPDGLTTDTRLAVLDDNNCPTAYITLADLMTFLTDNQEPVPLCEMVTASPGQPTADMMLIGLIDGCTVAKVPASAFDCTNTDPEDFSCE